MHGFELVYEEGPCLVVNKPGGVLTQAPSGIDSLELRVKQFLAAREAHAGRVYLGVPHRLDRPVSGLLVLGRNRRATRRLCDQFEGRTIAKKYCALVEGMVQPDEGRWVDWVRKVPGEARAETVPADHPDAREARLTYRVAMRWEHRSLLEIELETGRMHQIRVQAAARGHAVAGDEQYGATTSFGPVVDDARERWIALHARSLEFRHPMSREKVSVTSALPEFWPNW